MFKSFMTEDCALAFPVSNEALDWRLSLDYCTDVIHVRQAVEALSQTLSNIALSALSPDQNYTLIDRFHSLERNSGNTYYVPGYLLIVVQLP